MILNWVWAVPCVQEVIPKPPAARFVRPVAHSDQFGRSLWRRKSSMQIMAEIAVLKPDAVDLNAIQAAFPYGNVTLQPCKVAWTSQTQINQMA